MAVPLGGSIWSLVLVLVALGIFLSSLSNQIKERRDLKQYARQFAERVSPLLLAVGGAVQVVTPVVGMEATAEAFLSGVHLGGVLVVGVVVVYAWTYFQGSRASRG